MQKTSSSSSFFKQQFLLIFLAITIAAVLLFTNAAAKFKLAENQSAQNFVNLMAQKYQFDSDYVADLLSHANIRTELLNLVQHPYEENPWYLYKQRLVNKQRIVSGLQYWQKHSKALKYAEKTYGIPAAVIVAIIGVESRYGQVRMKYSVLDTLVTLGFLYPPRAKFFQSELEQYLLLARDLNINPKSIYGSYAGAIGLPQFMPSSYRRFAIPYCPPNEEEEAACDPDKLGNLINDSDDVVVSVANYLNHFGWHKNCAIAIQAKVQGHKYQRLLTDEQLAKLHSFLQLRRYGIKPRQKISRRTAKAYVTLIPLQTSATGYEYWLGFNNFHVIGRYNNNAQYIMAVFYLAAALEYAKKHQHVQ